MDAIGPSAPQAQASSGILESTAPVPILTAPPVTPGKQETGLSSRSPPSRYLPLPPLRAMMKE